MPKEQHHPFNCINFISSIPPGRTVHPICCRSSRGSSIRFPYSSTHTTPRTFHNISFKRRCRSLSRSLPFSEASPAATTLPDSFINYKFFLSQSHFHFRLRIVNPYPLNPHTSLSFQGRRREKEKRRRKGRRLLLKNITPLILKGCHSNYNLHLKARQERKREERQH